MLQYKLLRYIPVSSIFKRVFWSAFLAFCVYLYLFDYQWNTKFNHHQQLLSSARNTNIKLILFWTKGWSSRKQPVKGWDITNETLENCKFKCDFTDDKSLLDISDALVYHGVNWKYFNIFGLPLLPKKRPNFDQIWTFLRLESPANQPHNFKAFDNLFNWTATYRFDSDVHYPYGNIEHIDNNSMPYSEMKSMSDTFNRNKSLVGWMVSNCDVQSKRDVLVEKLKTYIPVDIYGSCSSSGQRLDCGGDDCYSTLANQYKFWLSFEKSLCTDYLTEKFYNPLFYGMVPILYAHPSVTRFIPKGSYIDVNDFTTIQELAKYLMYLDGEPKEYLKYFEWKKHFRVTLGSNFWCSFCTKLYGNVTRRSYSSIDEWFYFNYTKNYLCVEPSY